MKRKKGKSKNNKQGKIDFGIRLSSRTGMAASILVIIETLLFLGGVYVSYLNKGKAGFFIGIIGIAVFVLSIIGLVMAVWGLFREKFHHGPDIFGIIGNGLILIGICTLFVIGTGL